jgi:hypothetical protein
LFYFVIELQLQAIIRLGASPPNFDTGARNGVHAYIRNSAGSPNVVSPNIVLPNVILPNAILPNIILPNVVLPYMISPNIVSPNVISPKDILV